MNRRSLVLGGTLGGLGTLLLYLTPIPYQYPPAIAALAVVIGMRCSAADGAQVGVTMGICAGIGAIVLGVVVVMAPDAVSGSAASSLETAMDGMGPRNAIFYAVYAYFVGVYTALTAGVVGALTGFLIRMIGRSTNVGKRPDADEGV